jgi:hypothetical protein
MVANAPVTADAGSRARVSVATSTALARRQTTSLGSVDDTNARQAARASRRSLRQLVRRLIVSIRDGDEHTIEDAVLQLSKKRRIFAPLALAVGAFVMLFSGLRLLVTNWRLMLVQVLPAMLIWATTMDLKLHVFQGEEFHDFSRPIVLVLFAAAVLVTTAAFYLNAAFAFAVSQPGSPQLRTGFEEARKHARAILCWGAGTGLALWVAAILAPRWGLGWFTLLLGIVLGVLMVCYIAVPARIAGVGTGKTANAAQPGRDKLAAAAVSGVLGRRLRAAVCNSQDRPGAPGQQRPVLARDSDPCRRPRAAGRCHRGGQGGQGQRQAARWPATGHIGRPVSVRPGG